MTDLATGPLSSVVGRLRAAGEVTRLRILSLLGAGELTVSELALILGQSQPRVSRHLKLLVEAGLVERLPEGSWVFFRLPDGAEAGSSGAFVRATLADLPGHDLRLAADQARRREVTKTRAEAAAAYFSARAGEWDALRSLYVPEAAVEAAIRDLVAGAPVDLLVDLGTGTGRMLELLAPFYRRAMGFDVSHAMLSVARVNLERAHVTHAHVRHGDLFSLPLAPASADIVLLHQVLHYLDNPAGAVAAAAALVKPGGRLVIVDFAPHDLEFLRTEHAHRRLGFAADDMQRWLGAAGLRMTTQLQFHADLAAAATPRLTVSLWLAAAPVAPAGEGGS